MLKETFHDQVKLLKKRDPTAQFLYVGIYKPKGMVTEIFDNLYAGWENHLAPSITLHEEFNTTKEQNKAELKLSDIDAHNTAFSKINYNKRFHKEMDNPDSIECLRKVKKLAETKDIYLVCVEPDRYDCHRHLLVKMIDKILNEVNNEESYSI